MKNKNINFRLSMPKRMPKQARIGLVIVGALLVVLMGWMLLLGPKQKKIADLNAETAKVRQQIADDISRAAEARTAGSAPTIHVADVYKLQTAMPTIVDMPDLLLELSQVAQESGVTIGSLKPDTPTAVGSYSTIEVDLSVTGNFYSLTDLLYRLRNLVYVRDGTLQSNGRIFTVDSVSLSPSGSTIGANITLTTYVYGAAGSSTAGSSTAVPGATTTTTTTEGSSSSGPSASGATP